MEYGSQLSFSAQGNKMGKVQMKYKFLLLWGDKMGKGQVSKLSIKINGW